MACRSDSQVEQNDISVFWFFFNYQTNCLDISCESSAWHFKITKVPEVQMREVPEVQMRKVPGVLNITEVNCMPKVL